jgi:hypothetical protein
MNEYDPLDFRRGIEHLEDAELHGNSGFRITVLEIMLETFDDMGGNLHYDLANYVADLWAHPDDPVDFTKLHNLHYEFVMDWGSSMYCQHFHMLPFAQRDEKRQAGTTKERRPEINEWIMFSIKHHPDMTREELWEIAPEWITDQIGLGRFKKRVSAVRKKIKK